MREARSQDFMVRRSGQHSSRKKGPFSVDLKAKRHISGRVDPRQLPAFQIHSMHEGKKTYRGAVTPQCSSHSLQIRSQVH